MRYSKSIMFLIILVCTSLYTFSAPSTSDSYTTGTVTQVDDISILVKALDSNEIFNVTKSEIPIIDKDNNKLSWNDITTSSIIKIYFSGAILEIYPAKFEKVDKIVII
jgi:hypothetical protein